MKRKREETNEEDYRFEQVLEEAFKGGSFGKLALSATQSKPFLGMCQNLPDLFSQDNEPIPSMPTIDF